MSKSENTIKEVFNQFGVLIKGKVKLFPTLEDAEAAVETAAEAEKNYIEAGLYAEFSGAVVATKGYSGKVNIIVAYLNWVEDGRPDQPEEVEEEEATEVTNIADASNY